MSTYCVIGAAGASGLSLIDKLQQHGHTIYAVDIDEGGLKDLREGIPVTILGEPQCREIKLGKEFTLTADKIRKGLKFDAVLSAVTNYGNKEEIRGRKSAMRLAKRIANGAPIIEMSNGLRDLEEEITLGTFNSPSLIRSHRTGRSLDYLNDGSVHVVIGNDSGASIARVVDDMRQAGIQVDDSRPQMQVVIDKLAEIAPFAPMLIFNTNFRDAADKESPTGKLTLAILREIHSLALALQGKHLEVGSFQQFYEKWQAVYHKKNTLNGSLNLMLAAEPPRRTEVSAIYADTAEMAQTYGVEHSVLNSVHTVAKMLESRRLEGGSLEVARASVPINKARPIESVIQVAATVNPAAGRPRGFDG